MGSAGDCPELRTKPWKILACFWSGSCVLLGAQFLSSRAAKLSFTLLLGSLEADLILLTFTHLPSTPTTFPFGIF